MKPPNKGPVNSPIVTANVNLKIIKQIYKEDAKLLDSSTYPGLLNNNISLNSGNAGIKLIVPNYLLIHHSTTKAHNCFNNHHNYEILMN